MERVMGDAVPAGNSLLRLWRQDRAACGFWATLPSPVAAEMVANSGPDYVCVDLQHGAMGFDTAVGMLQAVAGRGVAPLVRVAANEPHLIMQALDAGALGVVVPMVSTAEDAAAAVAACRYPPAGLRSWGPLRASVVLGTNQPEQLQDVACIVMIETQEGLDNLEAIAGTEGLTGIYIGPADLSLALGLPPAFEQDDPAHERAVSRILDACLSAGIVAGITCANSAEHAKRRLAQGFRMVAVGNDATIVRRGSREVLEAVRGEASS
jgi:4-hydroxy-2-oxoheptanedioate aldolase